MNTYRLRLLLPALRTGSTSIGAQYNPEKPDEPDGPGTPVYTLTLQTTPTGLGTPFSINATSQRKAGEVIANLRANNVTGYTFVAWKEGDAVLSEEPQFSYTMPDHDVVLTACYRFTPDNPEEPDTPDLPTYSTVSISVSPPAGGTATGQGRHLVGSTVTLRATANQYYKFRDWTKDGRVLSTLATFNYTVEEGNPHLMANFTADYHPDNPDEPDPYVESKPLHWLHLKADPAVGGYTNPSGSLQLREGDKQQVQAYNNTWYTFRQWNYDDGTVASTYGSFTFTMPDHDVTLTAHYAYTPPANPDEPGETTDKLHIYALSQTGMPGQQLFFPIYLENPQPAQSMSIDVQMPEGFIIDNSKIVVAARAAGHELTVKDLGDNTLRLQLQGNMNFTDANGKLFDLPITIPTDAEQGKSYNVILSRGLVGTESVSVHGAYIYVEEQHESGLYAAFTYDKMANRVQFTNLSSLSVRSLLWDFGDGTKSTEASPFHIYKEAGTYTVHLTVQGQTDTDMAEMVVLVNEPGTWRTEGVFFLSGTGQQSVRTFATIDELFAFIFQSPLSGDIAINIEAGHNYSYLLTDEHVALLTILQQRLSDSGYTLTLTSHGEGATPVIDFRSEGTSIDRDVVQLFLQMGRNMKMEPHADGTDKAKITLWGIPINPSAYHQIMGQTIASDERTKAEDFKGISPALAYRWTLETPTDGAPDEGTGAIPSFAVTNKTGRNLVLTYHVTASTGDTDLFKLDYQIEVLPSVEGPDLTLRNIIVTKTELQPGDELTITWQTQNVGGRELTGGWSEKISLVNEQDTCLLTTIYSDDTPLAAGATRQRSARLSVPTLPGISGEVRLRIEVAPAADANVATDKRENNILESQSLQLAKQLMIQPAVLRLAEKQKEPLRVALSRSGSWVKAESFRVGISGDDRLTADQIVVIPAGQSAAYINIYVRDNQQVDRDSVFTLSVVGADYPELTARIVVDDDEHPALSLRTSKADVTEGDTFQLTVTLAEPVAQATTVSLVSEHPARFSYPQTVTIAAGETMVTIDVTVVDNDIPSLDLSCAFTAYVTGYEKGEAIVMLHDDDLPALELTLTPDRVKEGDGPMAVTATLRRTTNKDSKITVQLSDNSNGALYLGQTKLELAKGVDEVHFNLGPIDNNMVDGDRSYTITAAVWMSSCSCSAKGQAAGAVEAQLQVYDDDGPALTLASSQSTVKEGGTAILTVNRNTTDNTGPLTIQLSSNHDELFTYEHAVTIPAGQQQAAIQVTAKKNGVADDSQTVVFTVQADGFSTGTVWLMVTDQTLPDARIISLTADKDEEIAGGSMTLTVTVANDGDLSLSDATPVNIYRRGNSTPVTTIYTQMTLEPGEQETLTRSISLPTTTGLHAYYAVVNEEGRFRELSTMNNTSPEVRIRITSPYTATVQTDKVVYKQDEMVVIGGQLTGQRTMLAEAELYVIGDGIRQTFSVITDTLGHFTYEWQPYSLQMGHYVIGVCYPGEGLTEAMATVDIYGLRRQGSGYITCDVTETEPYEGSITLENPGSLQLTNVRAEVLEAPEDCAVQLSLPSKIDGGQVAQLKYTLTGSKPTSENAWEKIRLKVLTAEGAELEQTLYYYCRSAKAQLVVSQTVISTTITKGIARDYILYVTNIGRGNTGNITLALPDWMQSATGETLPPLAQNDTATVVLHMQPTDDMQLNVPVKGYFGINCQKGNGVRVDYNVTPVSDSKGTLVIEVRDEYFYQGGTHVQAAEVVVRNIVTEALVAQDTTGADGLCSFTLPEGYYQLSVTANGHDSYQNNVLVSPDMETEKTVNLSIVGITVDWKVEETEIEDKYEVVTSLNYSTNVPVPVVVLDVPTRIAADSLQSGESLIFYATLTNKGLIRTEDVSLLLPTGFTQLTFEPLTAYQGLTLSAGQSITIPVKVTRIAPAMSRQMETIKPIDNDPCVAQPGTLYYWECGNDRKWHRYGVTLQLGYCDSNDPRTWNNDPNPTGPEIEPHGWPEGTSIPNPPRTGDGLGSGGYGYGSSSGQNKISEVEDKGCEPCQNDFLIKLLECTPTLGPIVTAVKNIGNNVVKTNKCLRAAYRDDKDLAEKLALCPFTERVGEVVEISPTLFKVISNLPSSTDSEEELLQKKEMLEEAQDELIKHLQKELEKELKKELANISKELLIEMICDKYPAFAEVMEKIEELEKTYETLQKKSNKIVETAEELSEADRSDIAGVLRCTCELTIAIGSVLLETPTLKSLGEKMQNSSKILKKSACLFGLAFYECKYEGASARSSERGTSSTGNVAIDDYIEALRAFTNEQNAGDVIKEEIFGDPIWMEVPMAQFIPLYLYLTENTQTNSMRRYILKPEGVSFEQFDAFVERWRAIFNTDEGYKGLLNLDLIRQQMDIIDESEAYLERSGFDSFEALLSDRYTAMMNHPKTNSVCARINLDLPQTIQLTRQAFRGTLTVSNGHEDTAMRDMKLTLLVTSGDIVATPREFDIHVESLQGFSGELNMESGWTLEAQQTGTATILFTPTKYASPSKPIQWSFGGVVSYIDPFTNKEVRRELYPVTLTVQPSPEFDLDYFLQRDVYGDNPLTEEKEQVLPAEFALIISNKGEGEAKNVKMTTQQPQIVENEKGLAINFSIDSTAVNGNPVSTLVYNGVLQNDFGTIAAHSQSYAQWWLSSSLLGHFTTYDVRMNHQTSHGNADLSLIDKVSVHELIHGFTADKEQRGFLVNDIKDSNDLPDFIYFTDATQENVSIANAANVTRQGDDYCLTIGADKPGWHYGYIPDPTNGILLLTNVVRQSDGTKVPTDNVWQTTYVMRDGQDPESNPRLHFVALLPEGGESYLLTFVDRPVNATIVLDEDDTALPPTSNGVVNVSVKRTIKANEWSTICLPFAMNGHQVNMAFGEDAELCDFDGYEVLDNGSTINVKFRTVTAIEANHPYIVKVTKAIDEFTVNDVVVTPQEKPMKDLGTVDNPKAMVGNYINGTVLNHGTLFLYGGKFYYSVGKTKMQGFRAFFDFDDKLIGFNANARIVMTIDGIDTAINKVVQGMTEGDTNGRTHNLSGQRVVNPGKGVYIVNSRKMVIK